MATNTSKVKGKVKTKPYEYTGTPGLPMTPGLSFGGAPAVVPSTWDKTFGQSYTTRPSVGAAAQGANILDGQTLFDAAGSAGLMDTQGINMFQFGNTNPAFPNSPTYGVVPTKLGIDPPAKPFSFADWGSKNKDLINGGVGIANSLANAYFGWKNLGLARDQFGFQKDSWNKNFANQVTTTNNQLEEQARRRYISSPSTNITPEEYMAKHGVK